MRKTRPRNKYEEAYRQCALRLAQLIRQQEVLDRRILVVRKAIHDLALLPESKAMSQVSPLAEYLIAHSSLTDDITRVLNSALPAWLSPPAIRAELSQLGHAMAKHRNPLATIHMFLRRLMESGLVEQKTDARGKKLYRARPLSRLGVRPSRKKHS